MVMYIVLLTHDPESISHKETVDNHDRLDKNYHFVIIVSVLVLINNVLQ